MVGGAATAFYINDAANILPRTAVVKTRAFLAGATAEALEVIENTNTCSKTCSRSIVFNAVVFLFSLQIGASIDGLQELLLKNPALAENTDRITKMKRVIKAVSTNQMNKYYSPT